MDVEDVRVAAAVALLIIGWVLAPVAGWMAAGPAAGVACLSAASLVVAVIVGWDV